ncbi:MAG: ABC transporter permease [Bacilli bacterium]|nr:ABC transporter permease [Bacilli bacterium]
MRDILIVAKFSIKDMLRKKSFIVSTIIILLLIVGGLQVPRLLNKGKSSNPKILIVDNENLFDNQLTELNNLKLDYKFIIENKDLKEIKKDINNGKIKSSIIVNKSEDGIKLDYVVKNKLYVERIPDDLFTSLTSLYTNIQIGKLGLSDEQIKSISPTFDFKIIQSEKETTEGNVFLGMIISMLLYFGVYFFAYQISSSITTEKTSKIMETLVTSTSPRSIVLGKTIGLGIIGIIQVILIGGTAYITAINSFDASTINQFLDMSKITPVLGLVILIYFILGYLVYSLLYALTGSTVSKPEDVQAANTPLAILSLLGFYLAYFSMMNPTSSINKYAAIIPISSPFCMPCRVMMGLSSVKEVLISLLVLIITILVVAKVAIKVYSSAILNYGTKLSFKDIFKMFKSKD